MLTIRDLSKTYDNGVQALKGVNLDISRGMFGLLGPNGAGKSTLMRTIATLQESDTGSIRLDGLNVLEEKEEVRRILGYLPQEFGLYPRITAEAMLDHFAVLKGILDGKVREAAVQRLLRITNLWDVRRRKLGTFSGGMRQRFGIAQALLGDPELLIVDEPTAGLDPEERRRFLNLLSKIGQSVVVILSTHIVDDVREICGRMAIIDQGQVLLTGSPFELMTGLEGKIWERSIEHDAGEELKEWPGLVSMRQVEGRVILRIHSEESPGDGHEPAAPSLEDVYFSALKGHRGAKE
jgi:ABC-type multidrug transport system ATPase subunit